jgi:hypothetical protein
MRRTLSQDFESVATIIIAFPSLPIGAKQRASTGHTSMQPQQPMHGISVRPNEALICIFGRTTGLKASFERPSLHRYRGSLR